MVSKNFSLQKAKNLLSLSKLLGQLHCKLHCSKSLKPNLTSGRGSVSYAETVKAREPRRCVDIGKKTESALKAGPRSVTQGDLKLGSFELGLCNVKFELLQ